MTANPADGAGSRLADMTTLLAEGRSGARRAVGMHLVPAAHDFFRAQVVRPTGSPDLPGRTEPVTVEAAVTVCVAVADAGSIPLPVDDEPSDGRFMDIAGGDVLLVPHAAGTARTDGDVTVIRGGPTVAAVPPRYARTG